MVRRGNDKGNLLGRGVSKSRESVWYVISGKLMIPGVLVEWNYMEVMDKRGGRLDEIGR